MNCTRLTKRRVLQLGTSTLLAKLTQGWKCPNIFRTSSTDRSIPICSQHCTLLCDQVNGREVQRMCSPRRKSAGGVILIEYSTTLGLQFRSTSINWIPLPLNHSAKELNCSGILTKHVF